MAKILITGNGFDLFHHLPTKYGHFMSIMKAIEENNFSKIFHLKIYLGHFLKMNMKSITS
ncbi:AbiH family protein [Flavobacterium sp. AED]|uniref:AbiH family protein n=1 Tax=Flavobacterium sp. AED TaxID=1423323 RepID=UPI0006921803|nr:AbiH family protein [Flavobacterium sp. AED]